MRIYDRNNKRIVLDGITREFLGSLQELRIMHGFSYRHVGEAIGKIERTVCDYQKAA